MSSASRASDERSGSSDSGSQTRHVHVSDLTLDVGGAGKKPLEPPPEAAIILISHPQGEGLGTRWPIREGSVLEIGRSGGRDISLPDALSVSRRHAVLRFEGGEVSVEDLGSTNGTYVNDQVVEGRTLLESGDRFQVGTVHFKFLQEFDVEHAYYEALYHLAMYDGLTEVSNKRKFDEELAREFSRSLRFGRPLSLVLFDLDHFKAVNDEHGHLCGDHVLKGIASRARRRTRAEQTLARIGGEEFAILSPEIGLEGSLQLAEVLRGEIAAKPICFREWRVSVTCSFGVAAIETRMKAHEQLFEAADRALYVAKQAGRDRVARPDW